MKKMIFSLMLFQLLSTALMANEATPVQDMMHSMGKMYVVVAVIVVLFIGVVAYLIGIDRKLTKLENQIKDNE